MYRLFIKPLISNKQILNPGLTRIKNLLNIQYIEQQHRYTNYGAYINSDHFLIKLCYSVAPYLINGNLFNIIEKNQTAICSSLGITSGSTVGKFHHSQFYTKECAIYLQSFTGGIIDRPWRLLRPVRVLTHPSTNLSIHIPPITKSECIDGISVIGIDLFLFAYQFQQWTNINRAKPKEDQESIYTYVVKYVLTGMIPEQLDIAIRNQYIPVCSGEPLKKTHSISNNSFFAENSILDSINREIAEYMEKSVRSLNKGKFTFSDTLNNMPLIYSPNCLLAVPYEPNGLNGNSYWASLLLYTEWAYYLLTVLDGDFKNSSMIPNTLKRVDKTISSFRADKRLIDKSIDIWYLWFTRYEEIKKKYM